MNVRGNIPQHSLYPNAHVPRERVVGPVLGVVLDLHYPDSKNNLSKSALSATGGGISSVYGKVVECTVLVVEAWGNPYFVLPNCVVLQRRTGVATPPDGASEFSEEYPTPTTKSITDSLISSNFLNIDLKSLDGDWVIVDFIGGSIFRPIILNWYPHPMASDQLAKSADGQRYRRRHRGTTWTVTDKGDVTLEHRRGHTVSVVGDTLTITHKGSQGDSTIVINPDGELDIHTKGKIEVQSDAKEILIGQVDLDNLATKAFVEQIFLDHGHQSAIGDSVVGLNANSVAAYTNPVIKKWTDEVKAA